MRIVPVLGGPKTPVVLWWIVGAMWGIEGLLQLADHGWVGATDWRALAISYGAFWDFLFPPGRVDQALYPGQAYGMWLSHVFLHGGTLHVVMNTVILLALGKSVALVYGTGPALAAMAAGALGSAMGFGLLEDTPAPMVGASGVVFCLLGLWLATARQWARSRGESPRSMVSLLVGLVVVHVVLDVFMGGMIAWQAHLGGFMVGYFVLPVVLSPRTPVV